MAWIESHQSLRNHKKLLLLREKTGASAAVLIGHLHLLWWWALDNAPDGNLSELSPEIIAETADWDGEAEAFVDALVYAKFLDRGDSGSLSLHNWHDYAGKLMERRDKQKEAMRRLRASRDVNVSIYPTQPNPTVPNLTTEDKGGDSSSPPSEPQPIPPDLTNLSLYCVDKNLCKRFPELLPAWIDAFPGVDIVAEIKAAHAWELASPKNRKVDRPKFLTNWLKRAQDKPKGQGNADNRKNTRQITVDHSQYPDR